MQLCGLLHDLYDHPKDDSIIKTFKRMSISSENIIDHIFGCSTCYNYPGKDYTKKNVVKIIAFFKALRPLAENHEQKINLEERWIKEYQHMLKVFIAQDPKTPKIVLKRLAKIDDEAINRAILDNPSAIGEIKKIAMKIFDRYVAMAD